MIATGEVVFEVYAAAEGGYYAAATEYDIITQGDTWDEMERMAQEAVQCHFDDAATAGRLTTVLRGDRLPQPQRRGTQDAEIVYRMGGAQPPQNQA